MGKMAAVAGVLLAVCCFRAASGESWCVATPPSGSDSNKGTQGLPFATIQKGIDAAGNGDTVIVAEGTYVENIHFDGKNIILTGTDPLDQDVVAGTVIDGSKAGSVVTFSGTETEACVLSGFTVRNGESSGNGGGICGMVMVGAYTHATIRNNTITGNSAPEGGGGVYCCDGTIQNNTITHNWAALWGGGLNGCDGTIQNNTITDNSAGGGGGLYYCKGTIQNNTITGNHAEWGGGLIWCNATILNNAITDNSAQSYGGGLAYCDGTIQNNRITGNSAVGSGGGLAYCPGTILNNTIAGNLSPYGGGLNDCDGAILNNTITDNSAAYEGGGLHECDGTILNNTITGNSAAEYGGGLHWCLGTTRNCIIWGNTAPSGPQLDDESSLPTYSCIQDWTEGGEGNISKAPRFVNVNDKRFRLLPHSPCIDGGFDSPYLPEFDIAGMHRVMFGGKSLTVDMGAYEFYINTFSCEVGGNAVLTWSSLAGKTYSVVTSIDMVTWEIAAGNVPSLGDTVTTWTDTTAPFISPAVRMRFYRTVEK